MTVSTYASRFTGFSGQEFKTLEAKENGKDVLVRTSLRSDGEDISVDYLMRGREGGWIVRIGAHRCLSARLVQRLVGGGDDVVIKWTEKRPNR